MLYRTNCLKKSLRHHRRARAMPASPASSIFSTFTLHSTVTTLMSKRKASPSASESVPAKKPYNKNFFSGRDGLGDYVSNPTKYETSRVIFHNNDYVAINDMYPKSSVHTLLLPRSAEFTKQHPFEVFEDTAFLAEVRIESAKLKDIVAKELERKYGRFSPQDAARQAVYNGDVDLDEGEPMPAGRDWCKDVIVGVHASPSMNHLHVHVMSREMWSECLKHRKHYNSFATEFFVPLEDFPLSKDDPRRYLNEHKYLEQDMKCWKCGMNFGNKFARLKEHLAIEFEAWKKE